MRYIVTGGGSGGHIYPLLSFIEVVKQLDKDAEFLFVGKKDKMEGTIVPAVGIPFSAISAQGTKGKITWQNVKAAVSLSIGLLQAKKIIKDFKPDVCLGSGGYVSVPLMMAALKNPKIVTAILENDQFIGRANLQLARKSDIVFSGLFNLKEKYFASQENYYQVGHPRCEELSRAYGEEIAEKQQKTAIDVITFIGGSLGAERINEQAIKYCQSLEAENNNKKVILIAGKRYYEQYKSYQQTFANLEVIDYVEDIAALYSETDILVCRAGAGVLAEAATFELPTILVPSPNVMNNHQYHNAKYFVDRNAALMIEEQAIINNELVEMLQELIKDKKRIADLKQQIVKLSATKSVTTMYERMKEKRNEK